MSIYEYHYPYNTVNSDLQVIPPLLQGIFLAIAPTLPTHDFALSVSPSSFFPPAILPAAASFTLGSCSTMGVIPPWF